MPNTPDEGVLRDRIADGDAARAYARTHELTAEWIYEMTKRLFIEIERQIKAVEDSDRSSPLTRTENAKVLASLERTVGRIARTRHGRSVLTIEGSYTVNEDDTAELTNRFNRIAIARGTPSVSGGSDQ